MSESSEFVGTLDDVQQEDSYPEIPIPATVRVSQDGPVEVHILPSVSGGCRSFAMAASDQPKRVGNADPRRRSLILLCSQEFYVGTDQNEVGSRYGARWPANVPLTLTHSDAVYVGVVVDGVLSAITENWAS